MNMFEFVNNSQVQISCLVQIASGMLSSVIIFNFIFFLNFCIRIMRYLLDIRIQMHFTLFHIYRILTFPT